MKREGAEFVAKCLTCQKVKIEHKRPQDPRLEMGLYFYGLFYLSAEDKEWI